MNPEIEDRIRLYCKKCHMDCTNLEIIPLEDSYLAKDKTVKILENIQVFLYTLHF